MIKKAKHGGKRPGAGRPPKLGASAQYVTVRLPARLLGRIDADAAGGGVSRNDVIVGRLINAYYGLTVGTLVPPEA
jgi:hypothetical protein